MSAPTPQLVMTRLNVNEAHQGTGLRLTRDSTGRDGPVEATR
jgi:hypothetical protein